jgi:hypothetical protein
VAAFRVIWLGTIDHLVPFQDSMRAPPLVTFPAEAFPTATHALSDAHETLVRPFSVPAPPASGLGTTDNPLLFPDSARVCSVGGSRALSK